MLLPTPASDWRSLADWQGKRLFA